eukprot:403346551
MKTQDSVTMIQKDIQNKKITVLPKHLKQKSLSNNALQKVNYIQNLQEESKLMPGATPYLRLRQEKSKSTIHVDTNLLPRNIISPNVQNSHRKMNTSNSTLSLNMNNTLENFNAINNVQTYYQKIYQTLDQEKKGASQRQTSSHQNVQQNEPIYQGNIFKVQKLSTQQILGRLSTQGSIIQQIKQNGHNEYLNLIISCQSSITKQSLSPIQQKKYQQLLDFRQVLFLTKSGFKLNLDISTNSNYFLLKKINRVDKHLIIEIPINLVTNIQSSEYQLIEEFNFLIFLPTYHLYSQYLKSSMYPDKYFLETYLKPNSYYFGKMTTEEELIKAKKNFEQVAQQKQIEIICKDKKKFITVFPPAVQKQQLNMNKSVKFEQNSSEYEISPPSNLNNKMGSINLFDQNLSVFQNNGNDLRMNTFILPSKSANNIVLTQNYESIKSSQYDSNYDQQSPTTLTFLHSKPIFNHKNDNQGSEFQLRLREVQEENVNDNQIGLMNKAKKIISDDRHLKSQNIINKHQKQQKQSKHKSVGFDMCTQTKEESSQVTENHLNYENNVCNMQQQQNQQFFQIREEGLIDQSSLNHE